MEVVKFYKNGKFTGWIKVNDKTVKVIEKWLTHPGCTLEYTTIEEIEEHELHDNS